MAFQPSDIDFFLSGGPTNSNPNNSIGGLPSSFLVLGSMNNLFADVQSEQAASGRTDYRCFYIFNASSADTLRDAEIYFSEQGQGGSSVTLGIQTTTEIQKVVVTGQVSSGNLVMRYDQSQFTVDWAGSAGSFENNMESELGAIVPGVSVSTQTIQGRVPQTFRNFIVSFEGAADNRGHPLLEIVSNNLVGPDVPIVSVSRVNEGAPINSVAPLIPSDTTPPAKVSFYNADESSKLMIGDLLPGDGLPVWIKRVTLAGADYLEGDYFKLKIVGRPF
jgi:hypothetical protein